MFTSVDCDNWLPEAYFEELECFLSRHDWKMERYMFSPNQIYAMNTQSLPLLNKLADGLLGMGQFVWSRTLTNVQPVVSSFSLSFSTMKRIDFFDACADGMIDDYHLSCKAMWKTNGELEIVPINVMANMMSLSTGRSALEDFSARFWQAERHMMTMLDAAYNFNMLCKSPFHWRTLWFVLSYMQNNFISLGLYLTTLMFLVFKLVQGIPFSVPEVLLMNVETVLTSTLIALYFVAARKSAKILYNQEAQVPWSLLFQQLALLKIVLVIFAVAAQLLATIRIALASPAFLATPKIVSNSDQVKK
jgi:hypothetical protein